VQLDSGSAIAPALAVATRGIALAAITLIAGAVAFRWLLLRRWPAAAASPPHAWARLASSAGIGAGAALAVVSPLRLYCQARALVDAPDPVMPMMQNVLRTRWGEALIVQVAAALIAIAAFSLARRDRGTGWTLALVTAIALALTPAFMGHAIASQRDVVVAVSGDWLHVIAAGTWIGTLALMVRACGSVRAASDGGAAVATLVDLFHPIALSAATVILATGSVSAWLRLEHFRDLYTSAYGALLLVKVALVGVVVALGAYHSRSAAATARRGGPRAVFRSLALEVGFAVLVLAVTAVLVGTAPPMAG
jgi:putative copper export protein